MSDSALPQNVQSVADLVTVINRTSLIEKLLDQTISSFCAPRQHAEFFMSEVVLHTSVMSLGAKAKVVNAVAQTLNFKIEKEAIQRIINLRNAFAHSATNANPVVVVGFEDGPHSYLSVWALNSSGEIEMTNRYEAFANFNTAYDLAVESLNNLLTCIAAHIKSGEPAKLPFKPHKSQSKSKSKSKSN